MDLGRRTLELVDVASESRDEAALAALVLDALRDHGARDAGDGCVVAGEPAARVVLAGHLDTVPAQGNRPGRIEDGVVHGLGAADMKGALAVMIELARAGAPAGVVCGLAARLRLQCDLLGRADHAGTTPREDRRDAMSAAARLIVAPRTSPPSSPTSS